MRRTARQGSIGGALALLLLAPASPLLAQNPPPAIGPAASTLTSPSSATGKPAPAAAKTAAKPNAPAHPARKVAATPAKPKPAGKKIAAASKKSSVKIAERAKKAAPKIAAAKKPEPPKVAAAVPPTVPSYTITTTRDNVTYQTTRIVPIPVTAAAVAVPAPLPAPAQAPAPTPVQEVVSVPTPVAQLASLPTPAPLAERKPAASFAALTSAAMTPPPKALSRDPAPPPQPRAAASATGFVSSFLARAFRVARDTSLNSLQRRAELADLFAASMDVSRIAGITTGDELTGETSDFQRRFRSILISYLVETYYPRIELAADPSVTVETTAATPLPDGTAVVWTTFNKSSWVTQSVKWHLVPAGDGYKIVDIYSAGASLVQMERDTFLSVMRDGGLPELMAKIDARTRALASAATE